MAKKGKFKPKAGRTDNVKEKSGKRNPFEVHINRSKHDVVGRKRKEDRGLPGIARAKALKKREKTLLQEYKLRHKSNVFVDRRIGENDPTLDPEKKIALRLAAVKIRQSHKKSLYNLNDDDQLTHGGKFLDDDNFDDKMGFSDDDDDQGLDSQFVRERHFGGGFLTKKEGDDDKQKTKKEWIDEIIAESRKKKAESKREKEEQYEAVGKLDKELQTFMKMMSGKTMTDEDKARAVKNCEFRDYDILVKELGFDRSGKAKTSNKLKNPEEVIKEERERLLALETDRVRRMQGKPDPVTQKSKSADDLDDGFFHSKDDRFHVSYKDGAMLKEDSNDEDDDDDDDDDIGDDKEEREDSEVNNEEAEEEDSSDDGMENGDDLEGDESDQYSDIFDEDSCTDEEEVPTNTKEKTPKFVNKDKDMMEAARKEIPFTFEVPQDYEAFWALLENRSPKEVSTILERMIACNHPSLGAKNKEKCEDLCAFILQTLNILTELDGESPVKGIQPMLYIDTLILHLYSITQVCAVGVANAFRQVLEEKYEDCSKLGFRRYPTADCFVFLKVAGILFPSSDFIHPVMTPIMSFLSQLLGQAKITNRREITAALFTSYLLFEYLSESKRFVPELNNVLNGLLFMAVEEKSKLKLSLNPPFKRLGNSSSLLKLEKRVERCELTKLTLAAINNQEDPLSEDYKVNIVCKTVKLLQQLCECWSALPSIRTVMEPTTKLLNALVLDNYPECAKEAIDHLRKAITSLPAQGLALAKEGKKPKPIKMYEPAVERVIDGLKKRHGTKAFQEKQKLLHKLSRERKGAKREIQRDTAFLARQQLKETLQSDAVRKRKVGQILSGLQNQESEHKKLKLKKK